MKHILIFLSACLLLAGCQKVTQEETPTPIDPVVKTPKYWEAYRFLVTAGNIVLDSKTLWEGTYYNTQGEIASRKQRMDLDLYDDPYNYIYTDNYSYEQGKLVEILRKTTDVTLDYYTVFKVQNDLNTTEINYTSRGEVDRTENLYDSQKRLIRVKSLATNQGGKLIYADTITYSNNRKSSLYRYYNNGKPLRTTHYEYDSRGDLVKELTFEDGSSTPIDVTEISYTYLQTQPTPRLLEKIVHSTNGLYYKARYGTRATGEPSVRDIYTSTTRDGFYTQVASIMYFYSDDKFFND